MIDYIQKICFIYIDDIIIFGRTKEQFLVNVRAVLQRLKDHSIRVKLSKCEFCVQELKFLGLEISGECIKMDSSKKTAVLNIKRPNTIKKLRSFLGMTNYHREFIKDYHELVKPLFELTKLGESFVWSERQNDAFEKLKEEIGKTTELYLIDYVNTIIVRTDASDDGLGAVLLQRLKKWEGKSNSVL